MSEGLFRVVHFLPSVVNFPAECNFTKAEQQKKNVEKKQEAGIPRICNMLQVCPASSFLGCVQLCLCSVRGNVYQQHQGRVFKQDLVWYCWSTLGLNFGSFSFFFFFFLRSLPFCPSLGLTMTATTSWNTLWVCPGVTICVWVRFPTQPSIGLRLWFR